MLEGSFSAVPGGHTEKLWREFFVDPSRWWDHRPEKVTEHHSCQSSRVKVVTSPMSLCAIAWWTCMQNVGALKRLGQCLRSCHLEMLSLGPPSYWDMCNVSKGRRHWNYLKKCNKKVLQPDSVTFVGVLNACASILALEEGRCVHQQIVECGWDSDVFVGNSLVGMYAKCGSIEDAWRVFNKMPSRNVVTWNAMVLGHVKCGQGQKALELFQQMQQQGVQPNSVTFVGVLKACANVAVIEEGRCVHQQIIQSGSESDVFVGSSLVDMYAKCRSIEDAGKVYKKMPS